MVTSFIGLGKTHKKFTNERREDLGKCFVKLSYNEQWWSIPTKELSISLSKPSGSRLVKKVANTNLLGAVHILGRPKIVGSDPPYPLVSQKSVAQSVKMGAAALPPPLGGWYYMWMAPYVKNYFVNRYMIEWFS